jgi:hypothetical protein
MVAEFESDLIRLRTKEGMRVAKAKGRLRGKQPKLNPRQEAHLVSLYRQGEPAPPNWPTASASPAPPSTAPCNETSFRAWPVGAPPQTEPARDRERSPVARGVPKASPLRGTPAIPSLFAT